MNKKTKKALIGAGIVGFGFSAIASATYLVTSLLVKIALERDGVQKIKQTPKTKKMILGTEENEDFMRARKNASEVLTNIPMNLIEIVSFDGTKLVGHLYNCENPERVIIAMHGWRSSYGEDFGLISDLFHDNRCSVLYVEQRGQGQSGGNYMGFGLIERFDCFEWIKLIDKMFDLPIYLAGVSMGAATVLMTSGFTLPEKVKGIIADCGFSSAHDIWKHVANNNIKLYYGIIGKIADDMCRKKIQVGTKDYSVSKAMEKNRTPILFIHGSDDHFVPISMTFENYKACNSPKKLLVIPGADHAMSCYVDYPLYSDAVLNFFKEFDNYVYPISEECFSTDENTSSDDSTSL